MATASQTSDPQPEQSLPAVEDLSATSATSPSADPDLLSISPPSPVDNIIYLANRAGKSISQIAHSQRTTTDEIRQAIFRVELDRERNSSQATGVETRKLFLSQLGPISEAISAALRATKMTGKKVVMIDKESGVEVTVEEQVERPDHATRLQAIDTTRFLLAVVQPKDPALVINSNTQTNILNQGVQPGGLGAGGLTSPEAVIRSIVAARQNQLPAASASANAAAAGTVEGEIVMARAKDTNPPDEQEQEIEDAEDAEEDEDSDLDEEELAEDSDAE